MTALITIDRGGLAAVRAAAVLLIAAVSLPPVAGATSPPVAAATSPPVAAATSPPVAGATSPPVAAATSPPVPACDAGLSAAMVTGLDGGDTLRLDTRIDDATTARLAGIRLADEASPALSALVEGASVCLRLTAAGRDRYGRLLVHAYRSDGLWLQGEMLRRGLARVEPSPDARDLVPEMLAIEHAAETARAGDWQTGGFRVRTPADVDSAAGSYQVVEGRIVDAVRRGDRWYLNFGADWRSDFTAVIPKPAFAAFADAGIQPYALKDRIVRVRGWVELQNGPMIELQVPEQLEAPTATIGKTGQ